MENSSVQTYKYELDFTPDELHFIKNNENADETKLLLKGIHKKLIHQISGRKKAKEKLPFFYANENVVYPFSLSLEQCSSEKTALFKSKLAKGKLLIDLTTGFGIDAYFLSKNFEKCILVEQNAELSQLVSHNFSVLGITNCEFMGGKSAEVFLKNFQEMADVIYIDPARRDNKGGKVVRMEDCEPNVVEMMPLLLSSRTSKSVKHIIFQPFIDNFYF
jgi:hypothetical protein